MLHAAAYFLNTRFFYNENFSNDAEVRRGLHECLHCMILDIRKYAQVDVELDNYKQKLGEFGSQLNDLERL